ncbi:MAG TPA: hypothetical protein ENK91_13700 [Bacteroidetes bacterium]|nr:hypothetical protein [Bacteroidota bacterium]
MVVNKSITNSILSYNEYVKVAYYQDKKTKKFFENSYIFNKNTGLINKIKYDKDWHLRQSYLYNTFRIDYLNQECLANGMTPIFITLTLPSPYHPTSKYYDPNLSVSDGYQKLQEIFRAVYNDFKVDRKRIENLKFIRVIEPHKSWIPHLHAIVYVPAHLKDLFLGHLKRIIENNHLKQTDIKVLETAKYAVVYLLKYVDKTLSGSDEIRGWKIHHKIKRSFTMSNLNNGITRNIFKRLSSFLKYDEEDEDNSYLHQILNKVSIDRFQVDENRNIIKHLKFGTSNSSISISETIEVTKKVSKLTFDEDINLDDDMIYEDENLYKIIDTIVFQGFEEVYNMRDNIFYKGDFIIEPDVPKYDFAISIEQGNEKLNI